MRRPSWLTREVWGWSLFDFANQSFTIVVLTAMFQVYFISRVVADGDPARESWGRQVWSICGIVTQVLLAVSGPIVGALADFTGTKKRLLLASYLGCVGLTLGMAFVQPDQALAGAILFVLAYLCYGAGENLLSAFLPELASHRDMGRVSAFSWTIAYVGALAALLVAVLIPFMVPGGREALAAGANGSEGADAAMRTSALGYQLATAWAALFFLGAGLPMFLWVRERRYHEPLPAGQTLWTVGFHRLAATARQLARFRQLFRFLAIMTFYFAGMQVIYWFGGTLAKELFGFSDLEMGGFLIMTTVVAIPSAAFVGRWQDRIGTRNTILIGLAFWSMVMVIAALASGLGPSHRWVPWLIGVFVGMGIGGLGSASRVMVGLFSPPQKSAEFFGFYGIAHKVSAMLGLGWILAMERLLGGRFELVIGSATIFFAAGFLMMWFIDEREGRIMALRTAKEIERTALAAQGLAARPRPALEPPIVVPSLTADVASTPLQASADGSTASAPHASGPATPTAQPQPRAQDPAARPSFIYLDNNATTRPADEVVEAMIVALRELWANPSSVHRAGQRVRQQLELARESLCRLVDCAERELVLVSGGTEAANLAIVGGGASRGHIISAIHSRLEHSAVRELCEALAERGAAEVVWMDHEPGGLADLAALERLLQERHGEIAVVSLMWANNETGLLQPVEEAGRLCRRHGVRFHTDATQHVGRLPTRFDPEAFDLLSFAPHKFHGPKGVGALAVRRGVRVARQIIGGPQERERRGGTENVPGVIGAGVAAELARAWLATDERDRLAGLRDRLERGILARVPDAVVNGADRPRLWNTTNIGFPRLEAEAILLLLSERGVCASAGAACSSGSLDPSPVLLAMGVPHEVAHGSIRLSLSRETTEAEIDAAIEIVCESIAKLRRSSGAMTT